MKELLLAIPVLIDNENRLTECLEAAFEQTLVQQDKADIYVILNNPDDEGIIDQIDKFDDGYLIINEANYGVSGSWNQAILEGRNKYKYVCCVGYDTVFTDNSLLEDACKAMDGELAEFGRGENMSFNFWMVNAALFPEKIGLFDENYFPAYWEDIDMMRRIRGLRELGIVNSVLFDDSGKIKHAQSRTINDHQSKIPHDVWNYTYTQNQLYTQKKWGTDKPGPDAGFKTPFNNPRFHSSMWIPDMDRIEKHRAMWDKCIKGEG